MLRIAHRFPHLLTVSGAALLCLGVRLHAQEGQTLSERVIAKKSAEIDAVLTEHLSSSPAPGMAFAIVHDQQIVWSKGFGVASLAAREPVTMRTIFRIGSITKLFTATMLMQLRDEGKLALDQPVAPLLPIEIVNPFDDPRPVTFRQMVSHVSGFPPEGGNYWETLDMPAVETLLSNNPVVTLQTAPNAAIRYSNFAIAVMTEAMVRAGGQNFAIHLQANIFSPLGMNGTGLSAPAKGVSSSATGYVFAGDALKPVEEIDLHGLAPAGQAYSTASDLAKFVSLQFQSGPRGGKQVLGSSSLREMQQPNFLFPGLDKPNPMGIAIGTGWFIRNIAGHKAIGHAGGIPGFSSDVTLVPHQKLGVIALTNGGVTAGLDPTSLNKRVLELLVPAIDSAERDERLVNAGFRASWSEYLGDYDLVGVATLSVIREDGRMFFVHPMDEVGKSGAMLPSEKPEVFSLEGGIASGERLRFIRDESGSITGLEIVGLIAQRE